MNCPSCAHVVGGGYKCEVCGYVLTGKQDDQLAALSSIDRSLRTIKAILVWWVVLSIAAGLLYLVSRLI